MKLVPLFSLTRNWDSGKLLAFPQITQKIRADNGTSTFESRFWAGVKVQDATRPSSWKPTWRYSGHPHSKKPDSSTLPQACCVAPACCSSLGHFEMFASLLYFQERHLGRFSLGPLGWMDQTWMPSCTSVQPSPWHVEALFNKLSFYY